MSWPPKVGDTVRIRGDPRDYEVCGVLGEWVSLTEKAELVRIADLLDPFDVLLDEILSTD